MSSMPVLKAHKLNTPAYNSGRSIRHVRQLTEDGRKIYTIIEEVLTIPTIPDSFDAQVAWYINQARPTDLVECLSYWYEYRANMEQRKLIARRIRKEIFT